MVARTLTNRDKMMKIYRCVTVSEQHSFNGFLIAERRSNDNTQNRFKLNLRNKKHSRNICLLLSQSHVIVYLTVEV